MSGREKRVRAMAGMPYRNGPTCVSPRALYARPMALRRLYTDAGSVMRGTEWEAVVAHRQNSRLEE